MGINKVMIMGNLGADPDLKFAPSGKAICNLRIATTERWKDKSTGKLEERTEWHRVTVWGDAAENCAKYLAKGRAVLVEGKNRTRMYEKDGVKHYVTEIHANPGGVQFLPGGPKKENEPVVVDADDDQLSAADMEVPV